MQATRNITLPSIKSLLGSLEHPASSSFNTTTSSSADNIRQSLPLPIIQIKTPTNYSSLQHYALDHSDTKQSSQHLMLSPAPSAHTSSTEDSDSDADSPTAATTTTKIRRSITPINSSEDHPKYSINKNAKLAPQVTKRSSLPREAVQVLNEWLLNHLANPYPTSQEKKELLKKSGLTKIQLSNWFINVRRRKIFHDYYELANTTVQNSSEDNSWKTPVSRRKKLSDRLEELQRNLHI